LTARDAAGLGNSIPTAKAPFMTSRMTLPDAQTRNMMLSTDMERGMEARHARLETVI